MRVIIIIMMILSSGLSAWLAWIFFRNRQWAAVCLFVIISILTMALLLGAYFGWIGA